MRQRKHEEGGRWVGGKEGNRQVGGVGRSCQKRNAVKGGPKKIQKGGLGEKNSELKKKV